MRIGRSTVAFALVACGIFLSACGSSKTVLTDLATNRLSGLGKQTEAGPAPTADQLRSALTPELLEQVQGEVIVAEFERKGAVAIMEERGRNGAVVTFWSADQSALSFADGVLVATRGLGFDLMVASHTPIRAGRDYARVHTYLNGENQTVRVETNCATKGGSRREVIETCTGAEQQFTNRYWQDSRGQIIKSRQWIGPEHGYIVVDRVKR